MNSAGSAEAAGERLLGTLVACRSAHLIGHKHADGDCVGSIAALAAALEREGVAVRCLFPGGLPQRYAFLLPDAAAGSLLGAADCAVALDVATSERMGEYAEVYAKARHHFVIDHHPDNSLEADERWLDPAASSVAEMLWRRLRGQPLPLVALEALYVGMMTDTGRFSFANTSASTLAAAADLVSRGVDAAGLFERVFRQQPLELVRLESLLLGRLELHLDGQVVLAAISYAEFEPCRQMSTEGLAARTLEPAGVLAGALLLEIAPLKVKISLRSRRGVDVSGVARALGGGGHPQAAAAELAGTLEDAKRRVLRLLANHLAAEGGEAWKSTRC